jgi:cysteine-rich repeat protein
MLDDPDGMSHPVAHTLSEQLDGVAEVGARANLVDTSLYEPTFAEPLGDVEPTYCEHVGARAREACNAIDLLEGYAGCGAWSAFVWADDVPRCAVRLAMYGPSDVTPEVWAFDLSGEPYAGGAPHCGNGRLEPGEECDDGNTEPWDGCSETCRRSGFGGCETIIWQEFALEGVAEVLPDEWTARHTQLMTHANPTLLTGIDDTCAAARRTADKSCRRIAYETEFVTACGAHVAPVASTRQDDCVVRFDIDFREITPSAGVVTTDLPGLLTFTLR